MYLLVDCSDCIDCAQELERFNPELVERPAILALNKIDMEDGPDAAVSLLAKLNSFPGALFLIIIHVLVLYTLHSVLYS